MKFSTLSIVGLVAFSTALINCSTSDSDGGGSTSALGPQCTEYYGGCCAEASGQDQACADAKANTEQSIANGADASQYESGCKTLLDTAKNAGFCGGGGSGGTGNGGTGGTANGGTGGTGNGGTAGTSNGGTGGTGSDCTSGGSGVPCATCLQSAQASGGCCEAENVACNMNTECNALITCANGCGADQACAQQCGMDHPNGVSDFNTLIGCIQSACSACTM
ncbi:MAG: hypothetical protein R3B89_04865 [Polyangiaceae bacterium]